MRKAITLLLFVVSITALFAQAPLIEWQKSYGGTSGDDAKAILQTADGGYIVAGWSSSDNGDASVNYGKYDYWIVKLNSSGILQWQKKIGGASYDGANSIQQTSDGGYIVAGHSASIDGDVTGNHGGGSEVKDYWIVKLNDLGTIEWQKSLGGTGSDDAYSVIQTSDGGYIVAGEVYSNDGDVSGNHGNYDYWVAKLNTTGLIQWQKTYGGTSYDGARSIQETTDGGFIIAGNSNSDNGEVTGHHGTTFISDCWVVKIDNAGIIEWQKSLGGTSNDVANSVLQTNDGGYIVAGWTQSTDGDVPLNNGLYDYWLIKLDNTGTIQWQKSFGGTSYDQGNSISKTSSGGYVVAGWSSSNDVDVTGHHGLTGASDYWIVNIDNSGTVLWQKSLGGTDNEVATCIEETTDGGYIITGTANFNNGDVTGNHGGNDYWVVKLEGCTFTQPTIFPDGNLLRSSSLTGNQWYRNDTLIDGATNQNYSVSLPVADTTCYTVMVTDNFSCAVISEPYCYYPLPVGVSETNNIVSIFPNPIIDVLTISGCNPTYLKLCNTLGQTVAEANKINKLYVGNLSQGLYVLQLFDEKGGLVKTEKVVKE